MSSGHIISQFKARSRQQ